MAIYDNRHWLLSHIRTSFISSDDTGMCEIVMAGENLCNNIADSNKYPGIEENDDEDDLPHSLDNHSDLEFGLRRQRSNTAIRLEKMDKDKREAASITHIKWENPRSFSTISEEDKMDMFGGKNVPTMESRDKRMSLLTLQLQKCSYEPQNPFREYAKFDGNAQVGVPVRKYGIFLTMLKAEHSNYPMFVCVISSAKVSELIGFILWKCSLEYPNYSLKEDVNYYGLHIAEDDGEVDWVFPCLDPKEAVSKFVFKMLALVEKSSDEVDSEQKISEKDKLHPFQDFYFPCKGNDGDSNSQGATNSEMNPLEDQMSAIDAFLYKSYKVLLLNKVRTKIEVNLGISGEKIDIDPVLKHSTGSKFLPKRKPTSYDIDYIMACDLTETKCSNKAVFRLVYDSSPASEYNQSSSYPELLSWSDFKHLDFESEQRVAAEVVQKVNHILHIRCSNRRKEYLSMRERKSHRRRSFHLGPR